MDTPRRTALVCDDDPLMRSVFAKLLGHSGHEVVGEFDSAVDVVAVARLSPPDVIILDLGLMGMSGLDALPDLVEAAPACRVVVCTAFDTLREMAMARGATVVVEKADLARLPNVLAGFWQDPSPIDRANRAPGEVATAGVAAVGVAAGAVTPLA